MAGRSRNTWLSPLRSLTWPQGLPGARSRGAGRRGCGRGPSPVGGPRAPPTPASFQEWGVEGDAEPSLLHLPSVSWAHLPTGTGSGSRGSPGQHAGGRGGHGRWGRCCARALSHRQTGGQVCWHLESAAAETACHALDATESLSDSPGVVSPVRRLKNYCSPLLGRTPGPCPEGESPVR